MFISIFSVQFDDSRRFFVLFCEIKLDSLRFLSCRLQQTRVKWNCVEKKYEKWWFTIGAPLKRRLAIISPPAEDVKHFGLFLEHPYASYLLDYLVSYNIGTFGTMYLLFVLSETNTITDFIVPSTISHCRNCVEIIYYKIKSMW